MSIASPATVSRLLAVDPEYADGWVMITGTGVPVARIGQANASGQTPDAIALDWDLSLAQVHAALSYYYANQAEIDAAVDSYDRETVRMAQEASSR